MASSKFTSIVPIIQWYEGMMLSPHHFQQMEIRNHQMLVHQVKLLSSCHWGIRHLRWDILNLTEGLVRILELDGVLQDGTVINFHGAMADEHPLEFDLRPFKADWPSEGMMIMLCLKGRQEGISPLMGDQPRFVSIDGPAVMDENVGGATVTIPRLYPNIFLHAGNTPPPNTYAFPIMQIAWQDGVFSATPYTPPSFFLERDGFLWNKCAKLAQTMREKAGFLCDRWQNQVGTPLAFETEALLRPLMTVLPVFELALASHSMHPYALYQQLAQIVGTLSTLKMDQPPPIVPVYQHNDINSCYLELLSILDSYLQCIELRFAVLPFAHKERLFSIRLHPPYSVNQRIYVGLKMRGTTSEVEEWIRTCVVASGSHMEEAQKLRVTGVKRHILAGEELYTLMPGRGVIAFALELPDPFLGLQETLHVFHPGEGVQPTELMLFVPNYQRPASEQGAAA